MNKIHSQLLYQSNIKYSGKNLIQDLKVLFTETTKYWKKSKGKINGRNNIQEFEVSVP